MLIKIDKKEDILVIEGAREMVQDAKYAFREASIMLKEAEQKFWERIKILYPQVKKYEDLQIMWKEKFIIAMNKIESTDEKY